MNKEIDAEKSLCWQCKFGVCVQENEQEKVYQPNLGGMSSRPIEDTFSEPSFEEEREVDNDIIEHTIEHERVKTICFWRPDTTKESPPILVAKVLKCNRFAKE